MTTRQLLLAVIGITCLAVQGVACSENSPATSANPKPAPATDAGQARPVAAAPEATSALPAAGGRDFGNYTSQTLTTKAWEALTANDPEGVEAYTGKCIELYAQRALEQSMAVTAFAPPESAFEHWALNDVATSYFIRGKARAQQGKIDEAREDFNQIIEHFPYAQAWDTKGWFWKVAEAAQDQLNMLGTTYDFGDYTSQTLTTKAWQALDQKDYKGVELYTKKCIQLYEEEAKKQQAFLDDFPPKEKTFNYWALNDVGTCYFILGQAQEAQGRHDEAKLAFQKVVEELGFAQCWDPRGWFWKVAVASRGQLNKIAAESEGGGSEASGSTMQ